MHRALRTISVACVLAYLLAVGGTAAVGVEIPVAYESSGDGFMSLALCNGRGQIVRSLLCAEPVKARAGMVRWDGTDDLGRVCPAGEYAVRDLFVHRGVPEHIRSDSRESSPPSVSGSGWGELA